MSSEKRPFKLSGEGSLRCHSKSKHGYAWNELI